MHFTYHYTGFYGQWDGADIPSPVYWRLGEPEGSLAGASGAIQWLHPYKRKEPLPQRAEGLLCLAGLVRQPTNAPQRIVDAVTESLFPCQFHKLAGISDNAAGCFLRNDGSLYLWVGRASKDSVFFRTDSPQIRWSTNPLDLVEACDLDLWALRRCCHGDDVCIYPSLKRVEQGQLIIIRKDRSLLFHQFDQFHPATALKKRTTRMEDFLQPTRDALHQAIYPLFAEQKVGLLLSGGPGSAALLATLKQAGVNTIAYHLESPDPAGSEYHYANLVCEALDVPLVNITMDTKGSYLTQNWVFSHPYGHPWARWYDQVAQRARIDQVNLLVTGGGDDSAFGPQLTYGLHSLLTARIIWREKTRMVRGLLSTDWNVLDILRSLSPAQQLIGPSSLAGVRKEDHEMRRADFLVPIPSSQRTWDDIALKAAPCFSPQAIALEHAILQPNGIRMYNPYHQRPVQAISLALPDAYKLTPNVFPNRAPTARIVDKPILRMAFDDISPEVMWRTWPVWTQASGQQFCLQHQETLRLLLGAESRLAALGVADPARLEHVLQNRTRIRENYMTLITSSMVELFLTNAWYPQIQRGGPVWR
ncbi:asparagine synthase-related protein [Ktedonobacter racemifer]|uniref:Asparagine synthase n=1 Tax=Ktedonobacter racemifer DSM 44963 TaxID=485913 RepID=D6U3M6_KTERA|nr:asparagine synthase-related protein [Ktedonobacter racemifer]EFH83016.1 asparagine synthase [Ktedonobacter racemifer DSM 44963]